MPEVKISLTVTFETPPSIGAGGSSGTVADKVVTRNARGELVIPASQVKGKLRHACEQLLRSNGVDICRAPTPELMCPQAREVEPPCVLCEIFGSPFYRSRLSFHDLIAVEENLPREALRTMVSLNRRRRTAESGRLFLIETAPHVENLRFANENAITGHVGTAHDGDAGVRHVHLLLAGLKLLFTWGGGSSRGLGWGSADARAWLGGEALTLDVEEVKALCRS
jgi:CRISPR/Cas system CSM-associated protein Csm3 (group 7 of RAMP superfamily)